MRIRGIGLVLVWVVLTASCGQGVDCFGFEPPLRLDPRTLTCREVGRDSAECSCGTGYCVVVDVDHLDEPACFGPCTSAPEAMCLALPGCRAAYASEGFLGCESTAPSGPIHTGACVGLDAHACSRHDNCSSWYMDTLSVPTIPPNMKTAPYFDHCAEEVAAASGGTGTRGGT